MAIDNDFDWLDDDFDDDGTIPISYEVYENFLDEEENAEDPEDYDDIRARWDAYCISTTGHYVDPDDINL